MTPLILAGCTRQIVGLSGERWAAEWLRSLGWSVIIDHSIHFGDLQIVKDGVILRVEVKTAKRGLDRKYNFTLEKFWQGRQVASLAGVDYLLLLCVLQSGRVVPFSIPSLVVAGVRKVAIGSHPEKYRGRLAVYRKKGPCSDI